MIRAVAFDIGGVLCTNPLDEFSAVDREYGLPSGTMMSFIRGGDRFAQCEIGRLALADFNRWCVDCIEHDHGVEVPTARVDAMFHACMGSAVRPAMHALVMEVKAAGYQTSLLTNIFAERREWLHSIFPAGTIDAYGDSSELGLRKPDPAIYLRLLEMLGREPEEVAFVDDFPENLAPARALGMLDVLYESPEQVRSALIASGMRLAPEPVSGGYVGA